MSVARLSAARSLPLDRSPDTRMGVDDELPGIAGLTQPVLALR